MASIVADSLLRTAARLLGALAAVAALAAAAYLLLPDPLADVFFAAWVLAAVGLAAVGGLAAWTARTALVWLAGLLLSALAVVGIWSIGLFVAPAAVCLLAAATCLQFDRPRRVAQLSVAEAIAARGAVTRALAGAATAALGAWLVYAGAVERGLFGACARETLSCALAVARWDAVALTAVGLVAAAGGGWLCYRQVQLARVSGWKLVG